MKRIPGWEQIWSGIRPIICPSHRGCRSFRAYSPFSSSVSVAGAASYHRRASLPLQGIMARLVSTALVRGLVRSCRASSTAAVSRPAFQQFMTYSSGLSGDSNTNRDASTTRVAADPDTHQDFQPTSKGSDMSYGDKVAQDIKENPVLIYMKGSTDAPRCGFSALAVKVLQLYGSPIIARDILSNHKLKETVKAHTNWPTFPQIFIKGEFVGGSDIILSMHQKGELKDLLADIAQKGEQDSAS